MLSTKAWAVGITCLTTELIPLFAAQVPFSNAAVYKIPFCNTRDPVCALLRISLPSTSNSYSSFSLTFYILFSTSLQSVCKKVGVCVVLIHNFVDSWENRYYAQHSKIIAWFLWPWRSMKKTCFPELSLGLYLSVFAVILWSFIVNASETVISNLWWKKIRILEG